MGKKIKRVRLEFLRHGPPHNQLLSPLTRYLVHCDNFSSQTVSVPYEHREYLARNRFLNYEDQVGSTSDQKKMAEAAGHRQLQLDLMAGEIAGILQDVPGLSAQLVDQVGLRDLVHLELILSAAELSLLPFELTDSPKGCPGEGKPLTLQNDAPVCLTRRSRRITPDHLRWPGDKPRILFVAAAPGNSRIPFEQHLLALRQAIDPWVAWSESESASERVSDLLTVLPNASIQEVSAEVRRKAYTHIHILAHGVEVKREFDERFGLRLHNDANRNVPADVTAKQLAVALTPEAGRCEGRVPAVVTLASCYGSRHGGVIGAGSSIAHMLHEYNIPFVVSSQYPLSFPGSIILVKELYRDLLHGADPRKTLNALRRRLHADLGHTHDWASLLAYAALPLNIEWQLKRFRFTQADASIKAAFTYAEAAEKDGDKSGEGYREQLKVAIKRLVAPKVRLKKLLEDDRADTKNMASVHGLLASTEKREAVLAYRLQLADEGNREEFDFRAHLEAARKHYREAFRLNRDNTWALVQELTLTGVLGDHAKKGIDIVMSKWYLAKSLLYADVAQDDPAVVECAHSNLIELYQQQLLLNVPTDLAAKRNFEKDVKEQMEKYTRRFIARRVDGSRETKTRIRQFKLSSKWAEQFLLKAEAKAKASKTDDAETKKMRKRVKAFKDYGDEVSKMLSDSLPPER